MCVFGQYFGVFRYVISSVGEVLEKQYGNKKQKRGDWGLMADTRTVIRLFVFLILLAHLAEPRKYH